jgi:hypothetical protein
VAKGEKKVSAADARGLGSSQDSLAGRLPDDAAGVSLATVVWCSRLDHGDRPYLHRGETQ